MTASTGEVPGRIFMSYRREETAPYAGWLYDRLSQHFGRSQIFKDIDSIELGDDFVEVITSAVGSCDVLLALIGDRWLTITNQDGRRRLEDPGDFVRLEIEAALARKVRVIPILVEGARMPRAEEMPASLAKLARRQALELSPTRFDADTGRLLRVLDRTIAQARERDSDHGADATGGLAGVIAARLPGTEPAATADAPRLVTGPAAAALADDEVGQSVDKRDAAFIAQDLVVRDSGGTVLIDHVSFPVPACSLVGVIGPSGSGKSVLLRALSGIRPADSGAVLYSNLNLYEHYAELRHRIGLVPHGNGLHSQLAVGRALRYSAELRLPRGTTSSERDKRVDEVLSELGMTRQAGVRLDRMSGGKQKRADIAQELLTEPDILFVDEPASGLDPGLEQRMMEWMRDLASDGRTVVVVTHSIFNVDKCDRLLVVIPGGKVAFYGPPGEGLSYFGKRSWAEVFQAFERYPDRDWVAEFAASSAYTRYMMGPLGASAPRAGGQRPPDASPSRRPASARQMATLTRRYVRVMAADRGYLALIGLMPIVLGSLVRVFPGVSLAATLALSANAQTLLWLLIICACLCGTADSARELVKERSIYLRERAAELSAGAYLCSKLLVLGVISTVQSFILVLIGLAGRTLPQTGALLTHLPLLELCLGIAATTEASVCLGLLVSSLFRTSGKALVGGGVLSAVQILLAGSLFSLSRIPGLMQLAWAVPARWGYGAVASTADLNEINFFIRIPDRLWDHTPGTWLRDMGLTVGLAVIFALLSWIHLRRQGSVRPPHP
jgi:ABC-type multidrug transport system ATPase subunit